MTKFNGPAVAFSGYPPLISEAAPTHDLGQKMYTADSRAFRYVKVGSGAALVVGNLIQGPAEVTANLQLSIAAAAVGAKVITTTSTVTVTKDQYMGGYVVIAITPGLGNIYKIKGHEAATDAVVDIELEDPIVVALTTDSKVDLVADPYNGVIQNPTTASGPLVGAAVNDIAAGYYGWIQVEGPAAVLAQGALGVGATAVASNGTAGAAEAGVDATDSQAHVGVAINNVDSGEVGAVKLQIG